MHVAEIGSTARKAVGQVSNRVPWAHPPMAAFEEPGDAPRPGGEFGRLFAAHQGRECTKWNQYLPAYDRILGPYREGFADADGRRRPVRMLEIGVDRGGSLQLWRAYFGPDAVIHGVDINPRCADLSSDDLPVHIGSQDDAAFLGRVVDAMGGVDIVLDDGSHVAKHIRRSFDVLFPRLAVGGLYVIEDTQTAYWYRSGGGFRRPGTAVELAKSLVDGMHAWYFRWPLARRATMAKTSVRSVTFFDGIVAIEKAAVGPPFTRRRGKATLPDGHGGEV